ncbi:hydroxyproline dehydrogenase-like, partial [Malurus melanocephalus]|uniref:hydroxyproline dehydrogenase-like n=1 Tax=Malurus melanocephalus TaxID=175006 RepID=UPI002548FE40
TCVTCPPCPPRTPCPTSPLTCVTCVTVSLCHLCHLCHLSHLCHLCHLSQDTVSHLSSHLSAAAASSLPLGVKLVRGAYLDQERGRSQRLQSPAPTWDTPEQTSHSYERCLSLVLSSVARAGSAVALMVATHNEASVLSAVTKISQLSLRPSGGSVCFAQLLGMGDHLSLALAQNGFPVYKSVPLGPPEVTIPYLARRAAENRQALGGARRERQLLGAELRRRLRPWA